MPCERAVHDLMYRGSVGDVTPPSGLDGELIVWTQRSSNHVLQRNEEGFVGHLCRANDSEGVDPTNNLWDTFTEYGTVPGFLLDGGGCKHCKNRLESRTGYERAEYDQDGATAVTTPDGVTVTSASVDGPPTVPDDVPYPDTQAPAGPGRDHKSPMALQRSSPPTSNDDDVPGRLNPGSGSAPDVDPDDMARLDDADPTTDPDATDDGSDGSGGGSDDWPDWMDAV